MDFIVIETQSLTDSIGITILVEIDSMGMKTLFLAGVSGLMS